ncbi:16745_t:CDS:2 [Acaulospora morrowiae]|uniref:16745_t:CDS:1 n=1 Tax=Acaulospora morrowiae TaxID=94023 RepID=A0A9N9B792_9GLOM|nr:16745_t:CDS:2 [Acaulospora morrowiae]
MASWVLRLTRIIAPQSHYNITGLKFCFIQGLFDDREYDIHIAEDYSSIDSTVTGTMKIRGCCAIKDLNMKKFSLILSLRL